MKYVLAIVQFALVLAYFSAQSACLHTVERDNEVENFVAA
jgi:hypothetical protein